MKAGSVMGQYSEGREGELMSSNMVQPTFGSHILGTLHVVHRLEGLGLLPSKGLFIVIFSGPADAIEYDASAGRVSEEVYNEEYEDDENGGAEGGEEADDYTINGRV